MSGSRYWNQERHATPCLTTGNTHFWSLLNQDHMGLILLTVIRVIRKGFRGSPHGQDPEKAARCSEAPDEDALVQYRRWIIVLLLKVQRENQSASTRKSGKQTRSK